MPDQSKILRRLFKKYPDPQIALHFRNPLQLLVATILSAQCTDARVNQVTQSLFKKYRSAKALAEADYDALAEELRPTGFYKNKTKKVMTCCQQLVERFNGRVPDDLETLTTLPGVGRKTANMVLGNAFEQPAIAVDTHVLRVSNRLGLVRSDNPEKVEQALMDQIPRGKWTAFANAAILHGRETCTARKPRCCDCVLYDVCEWEDKPAC